MRVQLLLVRERPVAAATREDPRDGVLDEHVPTDRVVLRQLPVADHALLVVSVEVETVAVERCRVAECLPAVAAQELAFEVGTLQFGFRTVRHTEI